MTESATDLQPAVDALIACAAASTTCAASMVRSGGMAEETLLALDCADICAATARILARRQSDPAALAAVVDAAALVCESSATACGRHADHHEHCRTHSRSAADCAAALRALHP